MDALGQEGLSSPPLQGIRTESRLVTKAGAAELHAWNAPPYRKLTMEKHVGLRAASSLAALGSGPWKQAGPKPPAANHSTRAFVAASEASLRAYRSKKRPPRHPSAMQISTSHLVAQRQNIPTSK